MKLFTLLNCALLATLSGWSQQPNGLPVAAPGAWKSLSGEAQPLRTDPILTVDFADGIPDGWEVMDEGGVAQWEYRGPDTDPDNSEGSIGSCATGSADASPLASATVDNGFVIFDSAFWDDPIGPCGNLGTGDAPGPHFAPLTTPSLDFSAYSDFTVSWTHLYKQWTGNSTVYMEISVDGGEWEQLWEVSIDVGNSTPPDEVVTINLSEVAGGSDDVRLRWVFDGQYYWWMMDDIVFCEIPPYALSVGRLSYGDFDVLGNEDFSGLEYKKVPDEISYAMQPSARVYNDGALAQSTVNVELTLTRLLTMDEVYNQSSVVNAISGQGSSLVTTNETVLSSIWGEYEWSATVSNEEDEPSPENNSTSRSLWMTDVEFVRDDLSMDGVYIPTEELYTQPYEVGNVYYFEGDPIQAQNVGVGLSVGSGGVGQTLQARIYGFSLVDGVTTELVAESELVTVTSDDLNAVGQQKMVYLEFASPVTLQPDSGYAVMAYSSGGAQDFLFATSGDSPEWSSWAKFNEAQWGYLVNTPMVRLNLGEVVEVEEVEDAFLPSPYPNPADDRINLPGLYPNQTFEWSWLDSRGSRVSNGTVNAFEHSGQFQLATPTHRGVYSLQIRFESGEVRNHTIVIR